ncbi:MAG TPA: response regulator [Burkholderiales bacterium]|jgi:DNA-binding response OmpR family regulator
MSKPRAPALVVEDDRQIAEILRFILEDEGYDVRVAPDGHAAQQLIGSAPPPAIAILDVMLPHVDGFELMAQVRASRTWRAVPVIMLTARSQEEDRARGLQAGANEYMVKPFKAEELRALVRELAAK